MRLEVVFLAILDVFQRDSNVCISVGPGLFVEKSESMHELVDDDVMVDASVDERNFLDPASAPDVAPASGIGFDQLFRLKIYFRDSEQICYIIKLL